MQARVDAKGGECRVADHSRLWRREWKNTSAVGLWGRKASEWVAMHADPEQGETRWVEAGKSLPTLADDHCKRAVDK